MTLSDYIASKGLTYAAFAESIEVAHARTVERYAKGQRMPDRDTMPKIVKATDGAVTPNDFFGIGASDGATETGAAA